MLLLDRVHLRLDLLHPCGHPGRCLVDGFVNEVIHCADDVTSDQLAKLGLSKGQETHHLDEQTDDGGQSEDDRNDFSDFAVGIRVDDKHNLYLQCTVIEVSRSDSSFLLH